jgi:predicted nucleic acid-binding protein
LRAAILDTNVYIDYWERALDATALDQIGRAYLIRHSAVVFSELRRGARTRKAEALIDSLHRMAKVIWEPTPSDWWEAGRIIRKIGDSHGWESAKRRDFQNDTLIALTARRYGVSVVTSNRNDFELLAEEIPIKVVLL